MRGGVIVPVGSMVAVEGRENGDAIYKAVSYTHLRAHETVLDLVCRLLLEQKNKLRMHEIRPQHTVTRTADIHQSSQIACARVYLDELI